MVPGINPRPISALQLRCRAWYGNLGLIPGPIWKMSCNNLFVQLADIFVSSLVSKIYQTMLICTMTLETVCKIYPRRWHLNGNSYSARHIFWAFGHLTSNLSYCIKSNNNYYIFCCNMLIFACPIIAKSQCWLFAYGANIHICPLISVFALIYRHLNGNSYSARRIYLS
jgi:hypothetical protein